jgi:hypothetical protein
MTHLLDTLQRAATPLALTGALLALPGVAGADAITSATAQAQFSFSYGVPAGVTVEYQFDTAQTNDDTSTGGSAVASALQSPASDLTQDLATNPFIAQDSQTTAEAYNNGRSGGSAASTYLSNEGRIVMTNTTGTAATVTVDWQYFLGVAQAVTGYHGFADAFAQAEVLLMDSNFDLFVNELVAVTVADGGDVTGALSDSGTAYLTVPANGSNTLNIQLNTQTNAEFVPVPATAALLSLGLVGLRVARRTKD